MSNFYNSENIKSSDNINFDELLKQKSKPSKQCLSFLLNYSKTIEVKSGNNIKVVLIKN